ncbi:MAG TPA: valine--tRNA ligase [Candidatus Didemnitutus sp.]|nr:valine--tRNA ligase [Candidatus Didemnitutus sp.]
MAEITKSYEPGEVERKWYAAWLEKDAFAAKVEPGRESYAIVIPPPNVTGVLTMGHVLNNTLQDILIRRARLEGKSALWIPGTDHAGIATQTVVERELRKEKKTRHDLGRDKFLEKVWAWREEKGGIILEQLRRLGASCDWSRTQFTMDPAYSRAVLSVFVDLYAKGRIYRGKRMVNWCPGSLTALSDEEVDMRPAKGFIYRVRYERVDQPGVFIEVKTTRPETIPGDVAIAVHPDDPRYHGWIGRKVRRPLGPEAEIPIIADAAVDREFGSGALKITPAHDRVDFEIGQRHKLAPIDVLNPDGTLNELAGPVLAGLERFAGRKKAAQILKDSGALVAEEPYENNVGYSERAGVPIEPRLTWQWWLRYPRVDEAKAAVSEGHIRFFPERWTKVYLHWLDHIQDWCISRQLWWGHRIPVWYRAGLDREKLTEADLRDPEKVHVSLDGPADKTGWVQEDDVLDTWASSWIWPLATLGWPNEVAMAKAGFEYFYPTTTLVTGPDIIFFWVARMIMAGLEFARPGEPLANCIPFKNVYFTGIIRDAQGRKMSKSLGNSPDPLDLIAKYGADGLRFGIVSIAPQGQDIRFQEDRIESGKNFCNKLWNACRFRQMSGPMADNSSVMAIYDRLRPADFDGDDHAILDRLLVTTREIDRCFAEFEFSAAVQALYGFFWNDFCDWYVEVSKTKLQSPALRDNCLAIQDLVLRQTLLMLHPFIPFITEELWRQLGYGSEGKFIEDARLSNASQIASYGLKLDEKAVEKVRVFKEFVFAIRQLKASIGLANSRDVEVYFRHQEAKFPVEYNLKDLSLYCGLAKVSKIRGSSEPAPEGAPAAVTPFGPAYLIVAIKADTAAEKVRLTKELETLAKHVASTQARLANESFVSKAPPAVLEGAKKQLADLQAKHAEVARLLAALG